MRAGGFPGNPGGLVVSIVKTAGGRAPAHQARGRGRRTWRPTERTAGARMVPPDEGNEARGDGRRGVGVSHSTAEAGELSPRDPVEGRGHRQGAPLEGKTANTPRLGPVSTSRQRIAELARQAVGMAVAIAWLPGPAGTRRRVAKLSVEEPDAAEPARPDLWGARVSNDPGLPDRGGVLDINLHVRVCGEARGAQALPGDSRRSIPACAGKPRSVQAFPPNSRVHPRVCGEAMRMRSPNTRQAGPSPRVRPHGGPRLWSKYSAFPAPRVVAAAGGPRYDATLSSDRRRDHSNGIWLSVEGRPWNHTHVHRVYCALRLNLPRRTTRRVPRRV